MNKILIGAVCLVLVIAAVDALFIHKINREDIRSISYKDATYLIDGSFITLNDGYAEMEVAPGAASKITTRYFGNEAKGDLNNDGTQDVGFLLTQETGGNGTFFYVAVALKVDKGYFQTNTIFLGDRIAPQSTEIKDGRLIVNYTDRKPSEPRTAKPSVGISKYFKVATTTLIEVKK